MKMPKTSELRSEYIVQFVAPYKGPRLEEVQLEDHLYLVTMTQGQADELRDSLQRMLDAGFIVQGFSIADAEAVRDTPSNLRRRIAYLKNQEGA